MALAANLLAVHVPGMGFTDDQHAEGAHGDTLVQGEAGKPVDLLGPVLRTQFDGCLADACEFLSRSFRSLGTIEPPKSRASKAK